MKTTLAGVMMVILVFIVNFSTIHTNRLKSDSMHFKENVSNTESSTERSDMWAYAQEDHFKEDYGYTSATGKYTIPNEKDEYSKGMAFEVVSNYLEYDDNLFITSKTNSQYHGNLPKSSWIKNDSIVDWNPTSNTITIEPIPGEDKYSYMSYPIFIGEGNTLSFDSVYKIDYYNEVTNGDILYEDGLPHIILRLKNNSVESYTIVNPVIEDYDVITIYNIHGEEVFHFYRNYIYEDIEVPMGETIEVIEAVGHLVRYLYPQMVNLSIDIHNPLLTTLKIGSYEEEFYRYGEWGEIGEDGEDLDYISESFEMYGEDIVEIIGYEEGDEDSELFKIEQFSTMLEYIVKE